MYRHLLKYTALARLSGKSIRFDQLFLYYCEAREQRGTDRTRLRELTAHQIENKPVYAIRARILRARMLWSGILMRFPVFSRGRSNGNALHASPCK